MSTRLLASAAVLAASISAAQAGSCSQEIVNLQVLIDSKLQAAAAAGSSAPQSPAATMHRQPTPESLASAEGELGDISLKRMKAVNAAMARAREADRTGDQRGCQQALADAHRAFGK
jgi:hypothetical protein